MPTIYLKAIPGTVVYVVRSEPGQETCVVCSGVGKFTGNDGESFNCPGCGGSGTRLSKTLKRFWVQECEVRDVDLHRIDGGGWYASYYLPNGPGNVSESGFFLTREDAIEEMHRLEA